MMSEKIIVITGATEGIGKSTALLLAKQNHHVIIIGRNEIKTKSVRNELIETTKNNKIDYLICDLSSLEDVKKLSEKIKKQYPRIDVLINNAGLSLTERTLSKDGYEMTFAVNHLAHFLLTNLLIELLDKSEQGRIVVLSSSVYSNAKFNPDDLQSEKNYSMMPVYMNSKLLNLYFALELSERLKNTNITVNAVHPGVVKTKLDRDFKGLLSIIFSIVKPLFFISPEKGAEGSVYLATSNDVNSVTGKYFSGKKQQEIKGIGNNTENRKKLWQISESMTNRFIENKV